MRLEWSPAALADRDSIFDYTAVDSPKAAVMLDERIRRHVEQLIDFPYGGPPSRVSGMRELVVTRTPYVAVYRVDDDSYSSCALSTPRETGSKPYERQVIARLTA